MRRRRVYNNYCVTPSTELVPYNRMIREIPNNPAADRPGRRYISPRPRRATISSTRGRRKRRSHGLFANLTRFRPRTQSAGRPARLRYGTENNRYAESRATCREFRAVVHLGPDVFHVPGRPLRDRLLYRRIDFDQFFAPTKKICGGG